MPLVNMQATYIKLWRVLNAHMGLIRRKLQALFLAVKIVPVFYTLPFFPKKPSLSLGLDISGEVIKMVVLSQVGDQKQLESYAIELLPKGTIIDNTVKNIPAVAAVVKAAVNKLGIPLKSAVLGLPASLVVAKTITVDLESTMDEIEIQAQVAAGKYLPYSLDDICLDFEIRQAQDPIEQHTPMLTVLLVATPKMNIDVRVAIGKGANLETKVIDVESYALERVFSSMREKLPNQGINQVIAVIDINSTITTLTVLHDLVAIYTKEERFGDEKLIKVLQENQVIHHHKMASIEAAILIVKRLLEFFFSANSQYSKIDAIVLSGKIANFPEWYTLLQERLDLQIITVDPFCGMLISENIDQQQLKVDAPLLMVGCGLALRNFQ